MRGNHAFWQPKTKPLKATLKPHQCDIKATPMRVDSQAVGTPKPPQCDPKATLKPPQSSNKAPTKPPEGLETDHGLRTTDHLKANAEGRMPNAEVFSQLSTIGF